MLPAGSRVVVAVSGGPDSVCALLVLVELAAKLGISLGVAHFNHKLRGEASDSDERFVTALAQRLELPFHRAEGQVRQAAGNLEQNARRARAQFFAELIRKGLADRVVTGHTRDDQAETVLFRILRGTGITGLAGILPMTKEGIVRPLLDVTRAEVELFLGERGASWREDSSNRESRFARNRIRSSLLPQLEQEWNPQLSASLAHLADLAYEEELWLRQEVAAVAPGLVTERQDGLELNVGGLKRLPRALARRLVRFALAQAKGNLHRFQFEHVEAVLNLALGGAGEGSVPLPGLTARRSFGWIHIGPSQVCAKPRVVLIESSGVYQGPDGNHIEFVLEEPGHRGNTPQQNGATLEAAVLDLGKGPANLELRGWRAGDHYRPRGHSVDQKVTDMFQRAKVPSWRRPFWPIVTNEGSIVWARQFGPAAQSAAGPETGRVLRILDATVEDG